MDPVTAPISTSLSQAQPSMQLPANIKMNIFPTAMEWQHPLQRKTSRPFVILVSLFSFLNTHIPLHELLYVMFNPLHVLRDLGSAKRDHTTVDELLQTVSDFGCCKQAWPTKSV